MLDKKRLSDIVTTVLIILLVLVAIGILWFFVKGFIKSGGDEIGGVVDCFEPPMSRASCAYTPYADGRGRPVVVSLSRSMGEANVTGIAFQFSNGSLQTAKRDTNFQLAPLESSYNIYYLNVSSSFIPEKMDVYLIVGPKKNICRNPSKVDVRCTPLTFPIICTDLNDDGVLTPSDLEPYRIELYEPNLGRAVDCDYQDSWRSVRLAGGPVSDMCPDVDGDGVVRDLDLLAFELINLDGALSDCTL